MWLVHQFKPLLELASCKEYGMARKSAGNGGSGRDKKALTPTKPAAMQVVPEVRNGEARKNIVPINLEDEIRLRAYEIYLERGGVVGNQQDDWVAAEREVRSRYQQQQQSA
jgi:hypothetical protein